MAETSRESDFYFCPVRKKKPHASPVDYVQFVGAIEEGHKHPFLA
jgi:hypothetical protein